MSNVIKFTIDTSMVWVDGYAIDWVLHIPWYSPDELASMPPDAVAFEGLDVSSSYFDPMLFSDMPPGFMAASRAFPIVIGGSPPMVSSPFIEVVSHVGNVIEINFNFNEIYFDDPGAPFESVRSAYDWSIPNHGFYFSVKVYASPDSPEGLPSISVVRDDFSIHDETDNVAVDIIDSPILLTRNDTFRAAGCYLFTFKVGESITPPSAFWTNFQACVEDV